MHVITEDLNPFKTHTDELDKEERGNDDVCNELKKWALLNLKQLTTTSIANKTNDLLKPAIEVGASFCYVRSVAYPAKLSSIRRWVKDLNFKHCISKKAT